MQVLSRNRLYKGLQERKVLVVGGSKRVCVLWTHVDRGCKTLTHLSRSSASTPHVLLNPISNQTTVSETLNLAKK